MSKMGLNGAWMGRLTAVNFTYDDTIMSNWISNMMFKSLFNTVHNVSDPKHMLKTCFLSIFPPFIKGYFEQIFHPRTPVSNVFWPYITCFKHAVLISFSPFKTLCFQPFCYTVQASFQYIPNIWKLLNMPFLYIYTLKTGYLSTLLPTQTGCNRIRSI